MSGKIEGDVVVTSPPWGGPQYKKLKVDPSSLFLNKLMEVGKTVAPKMLIHLPKNINKHEVSTLLSLNINY